MGSGNLRTESLLTGGFSVIPIRGNAPKSELYGHLSLLLVRAKARLNLVPTYKQSNTEENEHYV